MSNVDETVAVDLQKPPAAARATSGMVLAITTAVLGWAALTIEAVRSIEGSLRGGHGLPEALFLYLRFFSILTNVGVAILMSVAALRLARRRPLPSAAFFNAGLVYILVTCITYEIMLRSHWTPRGLQFVTDTIIHDAVPALMLVFWLGFAPRYGARWADPLRILVFPALYLAMTLCAGLVGEGYPYGFLDVDRLGSANVLVTCLVFLAIFYMLGFATTACAIAWAAREKRNKLSPSTVTPAVRRSNR